MRSKWDKRAADYPRYGEGDGTFEQRVIETAAENGVVFEGARVLDIGCGTGRYTLRLAKLAKEVTGSDISPEMLSILEKDAAKEGLSNVRTLCAGWDETDCGGFDITFCTISPAIRNESGLKKMIDCAKHAAVYLGWCSRMESEPVTAVYSRFNITPKDFSTADRLRIWAEESGLDFTFVNLVDRWERTRTVDSMAERLFDDLTELGGSPDMDGIRQVLQSFSEDKINITYTTSVRLGLIIVLKERNEG